MTAAFKISALLFTSYLFLSSYTKIEMSKTPTCHMTISQIDSIAASIDSNKNYVQNSGEGDSPIGKGGFTTYFLCDKHIGGKLFRVINESSTTCSYTKSKYCTFTTTFYYHADQAVKILYEIGDYSSNRPKTIYSAKYYYCDSTVLKVFGENSKYSNATDLFTRSTSYKDFFYKYF